MGRRIKRISNCKIDEVLDVDLGFRVDRNDEKLWDRYWKHTEYDDRTGCRNWIGAMSMTKGKKYGYGHLEIKGKTIYAHRFAWALHFGRIPPNTLVLHKCDNVRCCNPDHLFLGTHKDNTYDAIIKGRFASGSKCSNAVLNEESVLKARIEWWAHEGSRRGFIKKLAEKYGVAAPTMYKVISGESWGHVPGAKNNKYTSKSAFRTLKVEEILKPEDIKELKPYIVGISTIEDFS